MRFEVIDGAFGYKDGEECLRNISFILENAELMSVLGANGAGKTTLLKGILGLIPRRNGEILVDGVDISRIKTRDLWKKIGYVPQAKGKSAAYTAEEMIVLGRNAYIGTFGQPGREDYRIAEECMKEIGIEYLRGRLCSKMSGGELQMVLIARALAAKPSLLVLDEPESGLDFRNQLIVLGTVQNLCREKNISCILNTHYPEHALAIADKALLLKPGKAIAGKTAEILTEKNLEEAFGVRVHIRDVEGHRVVIPVGK